MLVILSDMDNLQWLNKHEIYPDMFYTDFSTFKKQMILFKSATVVVMHITLNKILRTMIQSIIAELIERVNDPEDTGIERLYILTSYKTDSFPNQNYYYMHNDPTSVSLMRNEKVLKDLNFVDLLDEIQTEGEHTQTSHLYESTQEFRKKFVGDYSLLERGMIQKPNILEMMSKRT